MWWHLYPLGFTGAPVRPDQDAAGGRSDEVVVLRLNPAAQETLRTHRAPVALRRRHPWLCRADSDVVHLTNTAIVVRTATGAGAVVTALNLDDDTVRLPCAGAHTLACGNGHLEDTTIELPPRGWAVLEEPGSSAHTAAG